MKYFSKKYRLILLLSFLVVTLSVIKYFYKPDWSQENKVIEIKINPTPIPTLVINKIENDYPLNNILPYTGVTFEIKQYEEPLTLLVKVKSKDKTAIEKEMLNLFEKQKIDINSHSFDWQN